jgi:hypothetical protein
MFFNDLIWYNRFPIAETEMGGAGATEDAGKDEPN